MCIQLFNCVGYRLVTAFYENIASGKIQSEIDSGKYDADELIIIKVPFSLPYGPNSETFEKVYGNIEYCGITYQYVERRFYNDSLEVVCMPDIEKMNIQVASNDYFKMANDFSGIQTSGKSLKASFSKSGIEDFIPDNYFNKLYYTIQIDHNRFSFENSPGIDEIYLHVLIQPPEAGSISFA